MTSPGHTPGDTPGDAAWIHAFTDWAHGRTETLDFAGAPVPPRVQDVLSAAFPATAAAQAETNQRLGAVPNPKPGQPWQVTLAGVIGELPADAPDWVTDRFVKLEVDDGQGDIYLDPARYTWKHLTGPEPDFQPGVPVIDADGRVFIKLVIGWLAAGCPEVLAFEHPTRPLRRLVPEPEPMPDTVIQVLGDQLPAELLASLRRILRNHKGSVDKAFR